MGQTEKHACQYKQRNEDQAYSESHCETWLHQKAKDTSGIISRATIPSQDQRGKLEGEAKIISQKTRDRRRV